MIPSAIKNRFQIIGGRTFLDGKLVTVTSEPFDDDLEEKIEEHK
jgi:hypothetical protein